MTPTLYVRDGPVDIVETVWTGIQVFFSDLDFNGLYREAVEVGAEPGAIWWISI